MAKNVSEKFIQSIANISDNGDVKLQEENHQDWEIDKIVLTCKTDPNGKIECSWVLEKGKWVLKCVKV